MIVISVPNNYMYEIQMKINKKKVIGCIFTQRKCIYFYYEKLFLFKDWSKLFVRFIWNNLNHVVHTLALPVHFCCYDIEK